MQIFVAFLGDLGNDPFSKSQKAPSAPPKQSTLANIESNEDEKKYCCITDDQL